jgi:NADH-quinone oxidoreductase subunit F
MDLKTRGAPPTGAERAAIESVLGPAPARDLHDSVGGHRNRALRHLLLPTLHAVNDRVGWISPQAIDHIAERLDVSPADVFGVASFYALFSLTERSGRQVHTCVDLACRINGATEATLPPGAHPSPCLGVCERGAATLTIDPGDPVVRSVTPEPAPATAVPQAGDPSLVLLRRVGRIDPLSIDDHLADGGFEALRIARELGPRGIIGVLKTSALTGRGGAAFPTATKWAAVLDQAAAPHYLVANADESEPGTFKDRALIENDPYTLIEAMMIAGLAVGAEQSYIYLRGEYPRAESTLQHALDQCRRRGYLGGDSGFDVTLVRGAGAYICGEETAIFNSIEGERGEPRNKPPVPFQVGLFGKPTAVNNVETLYNVPYIIREGHEAQHRLFCLSGAVTRPGVYEVPMGIRLGELIELAGGLPDGASVQAVLLGGAAGYFVGPDQLELVLDQEAVRAAGLSLGSGVVMVFDQNADLVDLVKRIAAFFRDESCGQCVPCRVGTVRQEEAVERLSLAADDDDLSLLREIGQAMRDASICGLGQTAANAIDSAIVRLGVFR